MALKNHSLSATSGPAPQDPLEGLDAEELLKLRSRIDKKLNLDLTQLNLAEELGLQYRSGMTLLASVQDDSEVPANQRAQVFNSVGAMLEKIVKNQKIVYSAERLKRYESAFLKTVEMIGTEAMKKHFFDLYSEFLQDESKPEEKP